MQILTATQLPGDLARAGEVVGVLFKYGLAEWLKDTEWAPARRLLISASGESLTDQSFATRIRLALTDLGTTFVKLGQVLSTRTDLVGHDVAAELSELQSGTPADPHAVTRVTVEAELGHALEEVFKEFELEAVASASIGQVHRARLPTGRRVAVKVQHPGIEVKVRRDLRILGSLASLAERRDEFKRYQPVAVVREFRQMMLREMDFRREMRNLQQFRASFAKDPHVAFPKPIAELTSSRVLTMEYLDGTPLGDTEALSRQQLDLEELARRGANVFVQMIFRDGFYHADPHPGNIIVLKGGRIGMLDCGMVGRIDEKLRDRIAEALMAAGERDADRLTDLITRICAAPVGLDRAGLSSELMELFSQYGGQSVDQFDVSGALTTVTKIIHDYRLVMPSRLSMLIKCLIMLEGTGKLLSPQFNLAELLEPYRRQFVMKQFSPIARLRRVRRMYREWEELAESIPRDVTAMMERLQGGKFSVHLKHRRLESSVNRLVFGLFTSALLMSSALLWTREVPPLIGRIPVVAVLGYAAAIALGARLLWHIRRWG